MLKQYRRRVRAIELVIGPSIAYVALTRGQFATIDVESIPLVNRWNWYAQWCKNTQSFYACRTSLRHELNKYRHVAMHRVIANTPDDLVTDHWNRVTLDNRAANLRSVTTGQNLLNSEKREPGNRPKNRGAGWIEHNRRSRSRGWRIRHLVDGKHVFLASFRYREEAQAFLDARKKP